MDYSTVATDLADDVFAVDEDDRGQPVALIWDPKQRKAIWVLVHRDKGRWVDGVRMFNPTDLQRERARFETVQYLRTVAFAARDVARRAAADAASAAMTAAYGTERKAINAAEAALQDELARIFAQWGAA